MSTLQFKAKIGTQTNSNMQNPMVMFTLSIFDQKTHFGLIWSQNFSIEIWQLDQFEYAEFKDDVYFFCFEPEIAFLGKFRPKNQNCQFKLKFVFKSLSGHIYSKNIKNQNGQFKLKCCTKSNSNMQNSRVIFIFL